MLNFGREPKPAQPEEPEIDFSDELQKNAYLYAFNVFADSLDKDGYPIMTLGQFQCFPSYELIAEFIEGMGIDPELATAITDTAYQDRLDVIYGPQAR